MSTDPKGCSAIIGAHLDSEPEARLNISGRWRSVRLARLIWKLPMYARVIWGLVRDPRTPLPLKALLGAALAYLVMPLDLIPDAIPILGQADDLTVLLLVLDLFIANAPVEVRREHMERAHNGTADLDRDLGRLRSIMGRRYDAIRDGLPELLERYGDLRDPRAVKGLLAKVRDARLRATDAEPIAVAGAADAPPADLELEVAGAEGSRDLGLN
jgi:uncharacterized membrane protein YkvA (DUF1232 family)